MSKINKKVANDVNKELEKIREVGEQYSEEIIQKLLSEHDELEKELADLKVNGNTINLENKDQYFVNQKRLKVLPDLITEKYREYLEAVEKHQPFIDAMVLDVYKNKGDMFKDEYAKNLESLMEEFEELLLQSIKKYQEMEELTSDYKNLGYEFFYTKGIYLDNISINHGVNYILAKYNMSRANYPNAIVDSI